MKLALRKNRSAFHQYHIFIGNETSYLAYLKTTESSLTSPPASSSIVTDYSNLKWIEPYLYTT